MSETTDDLLERFRADGWSVAVHNDYEQGGESRTFWLLTHPDGIYTKGEGYTDQEALAAAWETMRHRHRLAWVDVVVDGPMYETEQPRFVDLEEGGEGFTHGPWRHQMGGTWAMSVRMLVGLRRPAGADRYDDICERAPLGQEMCAECEARIAAHHKE